jgi:alpha-L-fucosidase
MAITSTTLRAAALVCCLWASQGWTGNAVTDAPGETTRLEHAKPKMPEHPLAPPEYRRPADYRPQPYEKSLAQLRDAYSEQLMAKAHDVFARVEKTIADGPWKATPAGIDAHTCPEWFEDAKFGIFIDWGLWSLASWAPKKAKGAMYPDWYELRMYSDFDAQSPFWGYRSYHVKNWGENFQRDDFIPLFQAKRFNPEALVGTFKDAGAKYVVPFSKHHSGFCLWNSSFTFRDSVDRGPHRDLMGETARACRKEGLKFGFYFSLAEWEYPLIGPDGQLENYSWNKTLPYSPDMEYKASGKIAVKDFVKDYLVPQAVEFIDAYSPDLLWYDGEWSDDAKNLGGYTISAYFYDVNAGKKEVAVNDRYGNGEPAEIAGKFKQHARTWLRTVRGDFFTDEFGDTSECIDPAKAHPWEANRGISQSFGNNWQDNASNVIGSHDFICMFADIVARGGNLLLIVNLDGQGGLPEIQKNRLLDIGGWLKKNGEAIYATRALAPYATPDVSYTRSKDGQYGYAIIKNLKPSVDVKLAPAENAAITDLATGENLSWTYADASKTSAVVALGTLANRDLPVALKIRLH